MDRARYAQYVLTVGLALVFAIFGYWKFSQPTYWIGWIPPWMEGLGGQPRETWLQVAGGLELALAVLILIPIEGIRRIGVTVMIVHLFAVLTQTGWSDTGVRDMGLLASSIALFLLL